MFSAEQFHRVQGICKKTLPVVVIAILSINTVSADVSDINGEIDRCSKSHDYDPAAMDGKLGDKELGKNERAFLQCVYSGIEQNIMPRAFIPADYDYLIRQHKELTDAIEKGETTRQQRRARTQDLLNKVKANEMAETERRIQDLSAKRDQFMRQQEQMRKRNPRLF